MAESLLFLPDISGFTHFVQTTEARHSQHVIAELLELLLSSNKLDMQLAEVEGDALFFYKEEIPSASELLDQVKSMFEAFYSHLKSLEKNRICPCNACSTASQLELKIVAHSGSIEFINVQGKKKPFGPEVIEAHRLLKNSVDSDNYFLISEALENRVSIIDQKDDLFKFVKGEDEYDDNLIHYHYSNIDKSKLHLQHVDNAENIKLDREADVVLQREYNISGRELLEYISNYRFRHHWIDGVDKFEYNENEVTRVGSPHLCVINGKDLDFTTVVKEVPKGEYCYGELTHSIPTVDDLYQFFNIRPLTENSCLLILEVYAMCKSPIKRLINRIILSRVIRKNFLKALDKLEQFITNPEKEPV